MPAPRGALLPGLSALAIVGCDCGESGGVGSLDRDASAELDASPDGSLETGWSEGTLFELGEDGECRTTDEGPRQEEAWHAGGVDSVEPEEGLGLALAAGGELFLTGQFEGRASFGGPELDAVGAQDLFVLGLDPGGAFRFSRSSGTTSTDRGMALVVDAERNVTIAGHFGARGSGIDLGDGEVVAVGSPDGYVASYDGRGRHRWSRRFGGDVGSTYAHALAVDLDGNVYVTGFFAGRTTFGGTEVDAGPVSDLFVASYDASGTHRWSRTWGGTDWVRGRGIAVAPSGNVYVTGWFHGDVDFGGGVLTAVGPENADILLVALDAAGEHLWSERFGDIGTDVGYSIALDGDENLYVTGEIADATGVGGEVLAPFGSADVFVASYDRQGGHRWSRRFGSTGLDLGEAIVRRDDGMLLVTGRIEGSPCGVATRGAAAFILELEGSGEPRWMALVDGPGEDWARALALTPDQRSLVVTGQYAERLDFAGRSLPSTGPTDLFVLRLGL